MNQENLSEFIPPEFDITKYDAAANMELVNWLENLTMRMLGYHAIGKSIDEQTKKLILELTQKNISLGVVLESSYAKILNDMLAEDNAQYASVVRQLTYFDLFSTADGLKTADLEQLYSAVQTNIYPLINQNSLGQLNEFMQIEAMDGKDNLAWLEIDLNCSKNEILDAVSGWVANAKAERQATQKTNNRERKINSFNLVAFRKWHDARVLAYLDLATWNSLVGNKVTSPILGKILFPDPRDVVGKAGRIDDSSKHYANILTSQASLRRMLNVLADANRKKNTQKTS